jgi:hypothetical protein
MYGLCVLDVICDIDDKSLVCRGTTPSPQDLHTAPTAPPGWNGPLHALIRRNCSWCLRGLSGECLFAAVEGIFDVVCISHVISAPSHAAKIVDSPARLLEHPVVVSRGPSLPDEMAPVIEEGLAHETVAANEISHDGFDSVGKSSPPRSETHGVPITCKEKEREGEFGEGV